MRINNIYFLWKTSRNMAPYYAVAKGRNAGIYNTWDDCKMQVNQYSGSVYKKFNSKAEAESFIRQNSSIDTGYAGNSTRAYSGRYNVNTNEDAEYGGNTAPKYSRRSQSQTMRSSESYANEYSMPAYDSATKETSSDYITDSDGYVNVYTDGACSSNGAKNARAGIGVWFGDNHPLNISRPVLGRATNNMAEIQAVTEAAKQASRAEWMPKWKTNGWKTSSNAPVINKTELLEMEKALKPLNVTWNHVNGHVGIHGNEMADKLARAGCEEY